MKRSNEEINESLRAAAVFLEKVPNASKHLEFVACAIHEFLDGEHKTLDRAFGLSRARGQYERPYSEEHLDLVCKALTMRFEGKPWRTISELRGYSEQEFKRLWERYKSQAISKLAEKIHIDFDVT
jgi:hypothetical protein